MPQLQQPIIKAYELKDSESESYSLRLQKTNVKKNEKHSSSMSV